MTYSLRRDEMTWIYPKIEPYAVEHLRVSPTHEIAVEQSGNPAGKPVVFLHGGPGAATGADQRRFFDPRRYRIVLFDQRGCGRSRPLGSLEDNTTQSLIADMETIRERLGIDAWMVFGGSWGSTLALAYAEAHPQRVTELVLRGIFLGRQEEMDWLYGTGANQIFPDAWREAMAVLTPDERADVLGSFHRRLTTGDRATQNEAALAFAKWEAKVATHLPAPLGKFAEEDYAWAFARIAAHFFVNRCFLSSDRQLLDGLARIRHIPTVIVHGRYDVCCAVKNAFDLAEAWPEAELLVIPDAGHAAFEPGIAKALVAATDRFAAATPLKSR